MKQIALVFLAGICLAGCQSGAEDWCALAKGNRWSYTVNAGLTSAVREVRVDRSGPVGSHEGWVLTGSMGESALAWDGGTLYASRLAGTSYDPPLPVFQSGAGETRKWRGRILHVETAISATAVLKMAEGQEDLAGRNLDVLVATLVVKAGDQEIETVTSYANEIGVVRQEERHNAVLIRKMRYVSGP